MIKRWATRWLWLFASLALVFGGAAAAMSPTATAPAIQPTAAKAAQQTHGCTPAPAGTELDVKVMGDSLMTNWGVHDTHPNQGWPQLVKAQGATHAWHVDIGPAVGATKITDFLPGGGGWWITECVRNSQPDIVTMDWRTNEQLANPIVTPAQLKANYLLLMDHILAVSPGTKFLLVNPPLNMYHESFNTPHTQEQYIAKMLEIRDERGTCWLDLRPFFDTSGNFAWTLLPDGIHPGRIGHRVFAQGLYGAMGAC